MVRKAKYYIIMLLLPFGLLLTSCQDNQEVFNKYVNIKNANWAYGDALAIEIPIQDTIDKYNLYINLRNNKDYPYSNLFLIARMTFPNRVQIIDTLEYNMTDAQGYFLGTGFSDLKENKLTYKEHVKFPNQGIYLFEIKQAMRQRNEIEGVDPLSGVSDVGISIEKIKK